MKKFVFFYLDIINEVNHWAMVARIKAVDSYWVVERLTWVTNGHDKDT